MSFPHRTAFYFEVENKVYKPDEVGVEPNGLRPWMLSSNGNFVMNCNDGAVACPDQKDIITLASTGFEDSEGNEIFEGNILKTDIYRRTDPEITCVFYGDGHFIACSEETGRQERHPYLSEKAGIEYEHKTTIIGHALTDPELVPDSFDAEGYFELHD